LLKTLFFAVIIAWAIALILPLLLKALRKKKGDSDGKK